MYYFEFISVTINNSTGGETKSRSKDIPLYSLKFQEKTKNHQAKIRQNCILPRLGSKTKQNKREGKKEKEREETELELEVGFSENAVKNYSNGRLDNF